VAARPAGSRRYRGGSARAIWAPVAQLGILVVDEEHEPSYKQEERLRYHARDLALVRAQKAQAVAVLGSATPSLETLRRAQEGKLRTLRLPERVEARPLPAVTVVKRRVSDELLTPELAGALRETLARREQAILFLNRRGHTRTLLCASCGARWAVPTARSRWCCTAPAASASAAISAGTRSVRAGHAPVAGVRS